MSELLKHAGLRTSSNISRFRTVLIKLMATHGINASELARRTNLPQPTIHRLAVGKTEDPKLSTLLSLANYFTISLDQLLGNVDIISEATNKNSPLTLSVPIISWTNALDSKLYLETIKTTNWSEWFVIDMKVSPHTFGLKSKPSMEPRFSVV